MLFRRGFKSFLVVTAFAVGCSSARPPADAGRGGDATFAAPSLPQAVRDEAFRVVQALWLARKTAVEGRRDVLTERLKREPMFKKATRLTLEARGYEWFFSLPDGPTPAATALLEAVRTLPDHGIATDAFPIGAIEAASSRVAEGAARVGAARDAARANPATEPLLRLVEAEGPPTEEAVSGLIAAGRLTGLDEAGLLKWEGLVREVLRAEEDLARARADLEVAASVAFFRYALDLKFQIKASPFRADKDPAAADLVHLDEIVGAFDAFARDPAASLKALVPAHPYYAGLMAGLKRYRAIADRGGFSKVPDAGKLKQGARGKAVQALKRRLAEEGYFQGDPEDPLFDLPLENSVKDYQTTHGFEPTGVVEGPLVRSLNVPIEQRIRQIELGLQRWRESEVTPAEPLYVRVNIPEFKMEVWEEGRLVQKHRVVVGNNNWDRDPDARIEGRINRTKVFKAEISQIILNPRWYVPARIRRLELDFEVLDEPDYFAKRKFKVKVNPDGTEEIYQDSGDDNALGRVKFVFPNPYGIFMHDTNQKPYFQREIRAFSHGCIRLQDPLEVAYLFLAKRANLDRERVDRLLASGEVREVKIDPPIPIFVEYNSVGVDPRGRIEFFSDVYQYDRDYFDGKIPYSEEELRLLMRKIPRID